jgi:PAS domain S-box-containing protein
MSELLRVLLVEDSENDALLLLRKLKTDGFAVESERVEEAAAFRAALTTRPWDLVLADYALPRFSGMAALKIFSESGLAIPFIIVSGTIGEEIAIEAMKAGAADYIMKDRLARLAPSIRRELNDARLRRDKILADESLRESLLRWTTTFNSIADSICLLDAEGRVLQCNQSNMRFLDKPMDEIIGQKCFALVHGGTAFFDHCPFRRMLNSRAHEEEEIFDRGRWLYVAVDPILDQAGTVTGAVHIVSNITPRKLAEENLRASLAEKEILLREIHHRVKNNMQVMISLLNLQAQASRDAAVVTLLKESQNRIRTMAIVHEKLYRSGDLSCIDFSEYIESLAVHLFQFFSVDSSRIRLKRETEPIQLDINNAIPCGLILNELISNSLSHAFPGSRGGEVTVGLFRRPDDRLEVFVRDDGAGFPAGLDFRKTETLGLQLVNLLVGQLDGEIEMRGGKGAEFRIVFPELKYQPRV